MSTSSRGSLIIIRPTSNSTLDSGNRSLSQASMRKTIASTAGK